MNALRLLVTWIFVPLSIAVVVAGFVAGWATWRFGSLTGAKAYASGYAVWPDSPTSDVGIVAPNETTRADFAIRNLTSQPVTILGAEVSCACTSPVEMPLEIPARSQRELRFSVKVFKRQNPQFTETAKLFLDTGVPVLVLTITGRVADSAPSKSEPLGLAASP